MMIAAGGDVICGRSFKVCSSSKTFKVRFFKLCLMITSIDLCTCIPVSMTFTYCQGHRYVTKVKLLGVVSQKVKFSSDIKLRLSMFSVVV